MSHSTKTTLLSVVIIFILTFVSCETSRYGTNAWQDLVHSRDLDQLKGEQLKPLQKNVTRSEEF